jgi:hypothetical protein
MPNKDYWWQLQGYMELTGLKKASLDYILIDTPLPIIQQDLKKLFFQSGGKPEEWNPEAYDRMYPNYTFADIPEHLRIKSYEVTYDEKAIREIEQRVELCRKYISSILPEQADELIELSAQRLVA